MCDYSLEHMETRDAKVGDKLVSTRWSDTITRGFSEVENPTVAVCLRPGTELAFDDAIKTDHPLGLYSTKNHKEKAAIFREINLDRPFAHHDVLEMPSGKQVLLTSLIPGQVATVLQLPTEKPVPAEEPAQPEQQPEAAPAEQQETEPVE